MFVDTSVIVAILSDECDAGELLRKIEAGGGVTSALVILESAMRLSSKLEVDPVLVEIANRRDTPNSACNQVGGTGVTLKRFICLPSANTRST